MGWYLAGVRVWGVSGVDWYLVGVGVFGGRGVWRGVNGAAVVGGLDLCLPVIPYAPAPVISGTLYTVPAPRILYYAQHAAPPPRHPP